MVSLSVASLESAFSEISFCNFLTKVFSLDFFALLRRRLFSFVKIRFFADLQFLTNSLLWAMLIASIFVGWLGSLISINQFLHARNRR